MAKLGVLASCHCGRAGRLRLQARPSGLQSRATAAWASHCSRGASQRRHQSRQYPCFWPSRQSTHGWRDGARDDARLSDEAHQGSGCGAWLATFPNRRVGRGPTLCARATVCAWLRGRTLTARCDDQVACGVMVCGVVLWYMLSECLPRGRGPRLRNSLQHGPRVSRESSRRQHPCTLGALGLVIVRPPGNAGWRTCCDFRPAVACKISTNALRLFLLSVREATNWQQTKPCDFMWSFYSKIS